MRHNLIFILILSAFAGLSCQNMILGPDEAKPALPTLHASRFATYLDSMRYALDLPALAAAIVSDTGIVEAAVGSRRYGGPANVTINDVFLPGSCAKSFTAVLLGLLVDEGKVSWTTTLSEIFPEYSNTMRQEYHDVNLLNLLSHSAGFIRDPDLTLHSSSPRDLRIEVVAWALAQPPAVQRGHYLYSNLGFIIAGAIAEKLADRPYEELLMEKIFQPLGLTTAGFGQMRTAGLEDQPLQHTPGHSPIIAAPEDNVRVIQNPAGEGLYMSVRDWGRYCQWVLACEAGRPSLLRAETARRITTPVDLASGIGALGWGVMYPDWAGGKVLNYLGSNGYNFAQVMLLTEKHFGVVVMTNQGAGTTSNPIGLVVDRLLESYLYGKPL
jgi:CubicO group peptidase (beta-lactamase class C family)